MNSASHRLIRIGAFLTLLVIFAWAISPSPTFSPVEAQDESSQPEAVSVPGSFNALVGCSGDWQPDCEAVQMVFDEVDQLWEAEFELPAGSYEYKVAINKSWDENYGANAEPNGPNIPLVLEEDRTVRFFYDHKTHWIADDVNFFIANVPGNYQDQLGCPGQWAPDCLRSWLQDPDGDGVYIFGTTAIAPGNYEAKVALNQSWALNYGAGGNRDGANIPFSVAEPESYVEFQWNTADNIMTILVNGEIPVEPVGDITKPKAHWVTRDTIAWDIPRISGSDYRLYYAPEGGLVLNSDTNLIEGGEYLSLRYDRAGLPEEVVAKFPHLENALALKLDPADLERVPELLRGQLAIHASYLNINDEIEVISATGVQIAGVLDDLYTYDGELGPRFSDGQPAISVWAPTAKNVRFHLFSDSSPETTSTVFDMTFDPATGVWSVEGEPDWYGQYYLFEVTVYAPSVQEVVTNLVTDPYSLSLSMNSTRSQLISLDDVAFMPADWQTYEKPTSVAPEEIVIYELHIRDFSVNDSTVPEEFKGTFKAFTLEDTAGVRHLRALSEAGLTHVHMLPLFDIATINEDKSTWAGPTFEELAAFDGTSDQQQALLEPYRDLDGFNWGYDPFHYTVPEGSYSTDPNGPQRILEFREMVKALNDMGLFVVMDVVYNHTNASGQSERSVLDRIVPGYYHRLDENGNVATSTCCANTATEHNMMRKLMIDSVVTWARAYKVDGFRFDLMGHHMLADMIAVREALDALTLEEDGVDGSSIYIYGEGWNFGEVANNARGVNATQLNIGGTGIGAFNDRLRDAVRGGNPFGAHLEQGFATGLYLDPNDSDQGSPEDQLARLLLFSDQIRIGLAGNLREYRFEDRTGTIVNGTEIDYNGSPAGYTLDPQENIVYISAHDNETWFDAGAYKLPLDTPIEQRVRAHNLGISIVALSQGVPFFHAGIDVMRTKSLDRNSYNSGDWFNRVDWTYQTNYFPMGLPPAADNGNNWVLIEPILATESIAPDANAIMSVQMHFREMLQIRHSSPLFTLPTAEDIEQRLQFHNTGPEQIPGLIVMSLSDMGEVADLDPNYAMIVVVFNASPEARSFTIAALANQNFTLHPIQANSFDAVVQTASFDEATGTFNVPGRTTAVYVLPQ